MGELRVTRTNLSDGRELLYFDEPGTPERTASDFRDLPRVQTESWMRRDPLTGDWAIYAAHRQNRTFLPPANEDPWLLHVWDSILVKFPKTITK